MQSQKTILIVNNKHEFLLTLSKRFQELGINIITATDGLDALLLAATEAPDLIILDIDLPGADGLEICVKLSQNASTSDIPVIILTGKTDEETLHRCRHLGAHYIRKDLQYWPDLKSMVCDYLDVAPAPANQQNLKREASLHSSTGPSAPKILVIDDDPQITQGLTIRLGALGLDVIGAPNASGGTYLAWTESPDLIITDQNMPEMSGEQLIVKLKNDEATRDIPVVVITGQKVDGREDMWLKRQIIGRRGAVAYLTKPVRFDELVEVLRQHISFPSPHSRSQDSATG